MVGHGGSTNNFSGTLFPVMSPAGDATYMQDCAICHTNGSEQNLPIGLNAVQDPQGWIQGATGNPVAVSYTHLDVYKRQMSAHPVLSAYSPSRFLRRPFALHQAIFPRDLSRAAPRLFATGPHFRPRRTGDSMQGQSRRYAARQPEADLPRVNVHTEPRHRGQDVYKRQKK